MYQIKKFAKKLAYHLDFHKGENIVIKDLKNSNPLFSYLIIVSCDNSRKLNGLKEQVLALVDNSQAKINHIEDKSNDWVVIDLYDIVIHLMSTQAREKYNLDKIYEAYPDVSFLDYKPSKNEFFIINK